MDRLVNWGILSTARINRRIIPAVGKSPRAQLLGVASRNESKARDYADEWNIERSYGSYEALLADKDIDVVYISLPNDMHAEWAIKSMEAGKHVLCEKPLCLSTQELELLEEASQRTGKQVAEGFMYLHHPQTALFKSIVTDGTIGELRTMSSTFSFNWERGEDNYRLSNPEGGGSLWDIGVYPISFYQYVLGEEPLHVTGAGFPGPIDQRFTAFMAYENGVLGRFYCSFDAAYTTETIFHGAEGILRISHPYNYMEKGKAWLEKDGQLEEIQIPESDLYLHEVEDINDVVIHGDKPLISLEDSYGIVRTVQRLRESAGFI